MPDELKHLNKEDLFLLMESYRNMITMHSTLAEQQKQIIDLQNKIINKQDGLSLKQTQSCNQLRMITDEVRQMSGGLTTTNDNLQKSCSLLDKNIVSTMTTINERISESKLDVTKQHSMITNRIYITMGVMSTIIIGLITLAVGLTDKFDMISKIYEILKVLEGSGIFIPH